jgi:hypothetical protein
VPLKDPGDSPQTTTTGTPGTSQRTGRPGATHTPPITPIGSVNVAEDGGATADGPADDEEGESYAHEINVHLDLADGSLNTGNLPGYIAELAAAVRAENEGSDRGCFFIDEPADID